MDENKRRDKCKRISKHERVADFACWNENIIRENTNKIKLHEL